jgi:tetratricopeptide (TPR) repeat protein
MNLTIVKIVFTFLTTLFLIQPVFSQIFEGDNSGRTLALVIGISDYKYETDLKFADKDAEDFAAFLRSKDGMNLPASDVKVFTNTNATHATIQHKGLDWLSEELQKGDQAYIFYSGHGEITNMNADLDILKTGFLLTHESQREEYESTAIEMESFLRNFHIIASKKEATVRLIMDVCHAGIGMKSGGIINMVEMAGKYNSKKQIVFTSCQYDQKSYEYEALQNGVFTYFLIQGLKGAADGASTPSKLDDVITFDEVKAYTKENVTRYVKSRNQALQEPNFKGDNSHWLGYTPEEYKAPDLDRLYSSEFKEKGASKGIDRSTPVMPLETNQVFDEIEKGGISNTEIQEAYDLYLSYTANTPEQAANKRKMKRNLVAIMVERADKVLTAYNRQAGEMTNQTSYEGISDYYLKSAKLLGEDHFQYNETLAKYFFIDALQLKSHDASDSKVIDKLNTSLTLEPNASYTLNELGNVYYKQGNLEEALDYYQKAANISATWAKNVIKTNKKLGKKPNINNTIPESYSAVTDNSTKRIVTNKKMDAKDFVYHIQIASAGAVNRDQFKKIEDLGTINPIYNEEKNVIHSLMGPYEAEKDADAVLRKIQQRGFKDAFLVALPKDDTFQKKMTEKEAALKKEVAASSPYQIRLAAVKSFNSADFAKVENIGSVEAIPTTVKGKTIYRVIIPASEKQEANTLLNKVKQAGYKDAYIFINKSSQIATTDNTSLAPTNYSTVNTGAYRVQIASVSKLSKTQFSDLEQLGKVYVEVVPDRDMIRVYLGDFPTKIKANEVLKSVKRKGYKDAFVQQHD